MKELTSGKGKSFRKLVLLEQGEYTALQAAADHRLCNSKDNASVQQLQQQQQLVKAYLDNGDSKDIADRLAMYRMAVAKQQREVTKAQRGTEVQPSALVAPAAVTMAMTSAAEEPVASGTTTTTAAVAAADTNDDRQPVKPGDSPAAAAASPALEEHVLVGLPAHFQPKARKLITVLAKSGVRVDSSTGNVILPGAADTGGGGDTTLVDSFFPLLLRSLFVTSRDGDALPGRTELLRHMAMNGITRSMVSAASARTTLAQYGAGRGGRGTMVAAATTAPPRRLQPQQQQQQQQQTKKRRQQPPGKRAKILYMF